MTSLTAELLGARLMKARESMGLSQEEVAEALGVSRPMISYWETGKRTVDSVNLSRLAGLYGYSINHILAELNDELPETQFGFRAQELNREDLLVIGWAKKIVGNFTDLKELLGSGDDWV